MPVCGCSELVYLAQKWKIWVTWKNCLLCHSHLPFIQNSPIFCGRLNIEDGQGRGHSLWIHQQIRPGLIFPHFLYILCFCIIFGLTLGTFLHFQIGSLPKIFRSPVYFNNLWVLLISTQDCHCHLMQFNYALHFHVICRCAEQGSWNYWWKIKVN